MNAATRWIVILSRVAERDLDSLPRPILEEAASIIAELEEEPQPDDVVKAASATIGAIGLSRSRRHPGAILRNLGAEGPVNRYAIVIERGANSFGAWVPDLPGCIAAAATEQEVRRLIREAVAFHIRGLKSRGVSVPPPVSSVDYVIVGASSAPNQPA